MLLISNTIYGGYKIIAELDNIKIGYAFVRFCDVADYNITIAEIDDLYVEKKYRKIGIGTKLLKQIENDCKKNGADIMRSGTGVDNKASIALHEKEGYKKYRIGI